MYENIKELVESARQKGMLLWQVVAENEINLTGRTEEEIFGELERRFRVMEESARRALAAPQKTVGGLIEGIASAQATYSVRPDSLCGPFLNRVMAMALSCSEVNAAMGKICAAPTAGSCGILPAVLIGVSEEFGLSRRQTLEGMLTASGMGTILMKNATVSGAEGGCQAECGVAAAIAAAAAVTMRGGTPEQAATACSLALIHAMGLVCDPVAGLVQVPCAQRNASQAVNALLSADLALGGMIVIIPPDEVVEAMYRVGKQLPCQLKETAQGGLAATDTARRIASRIFGEG